MKKLMSVITILSLSFFIIITAPLPQASAQTENIESIEAAKELASNAGGTFVEGKAAPALTGDQIALPVIDEASGDILGHIVAERTSLVSALNAAGHIEIATAITSAGAGTTAADTVGAGFLGGTVGAVVAGVAIVAGIALAVSSGGGGGGSSSTSNH
ncbi:MAG: hypothetical protein ABFR82_08710 [Nitrospirota bacterium]